MLPKIFKAKKKNGLDELYKLYLAKNDYEWIVAYIRLRARIEYKKDLKYLCCEIENTEVDTRAKMLIYLIENKLIKL